MARQYIDYSETSLQRPYGRTLNPCREFGYCQRLFSIVMINLFHSCMLLLRVKLLFGIPCREVSTVQLEVWNWSKVLDCHSQQTTGQFLFTGPKAQVYKGSLQIVNLKFARS